MPKATTVQPDGTPDSVLLTALLDAEDSASIVCASAAVEWRKANPGADCPPDMIPAEAQLTAWLLECGLPPNTRASSNALLREALGDAGGWEWRVIRSLHVPPGDYTNSPFETDDSPRWLAGSSIGAVGEVKESYAALSVDLYHKVWKHLPGPRPGHAVGPMVRAWQKRPRMERGRRVDYIESREGLRMSKIPGLSQVASQAPLRIEGDVFTVESDGAPFLSPGPVQVRRYRAQRTRGQIDAFPATIDNRATGGAIVEALAEARLTGDERTTLRSDLRFLGESAFALTGPIQMTARELIALYAWPGQPADHVDRLAMVLNFARYLKVDLGDRLPHWLFDVRDLRGKGRGLDTVYHIGPGGWWQGGSAFGDANSWRLSGGLWRRPAIIERKGAGGTMPLGYWGLPDRIIAGIEAALQWGPSPGKGSRGRIPEALRPVRKGGPGPERFIPNWHVLRLAGEAVTQEDYRTDSAPRRRYMRAVNALEALGYVCSEGRPAPAGQTVEITRIVHGRGGRQGGLMVRATARFCDAYEKGQRGRGEWSSAPLVDVIANRNPDPE